MSDSKKVVGSKNCQIKYERGHTGEIVGSGQRMRY